MNTLTLYIPREGLKHQTGHSHPESPDRLNAILSLLQKSPFMALPQIEATEAELHWIKRAHDPRYLERLEEMVPDYGQTYLDNDTVLSPGSWAAALTAAGAVCQAVEDVTSGKTMRAFCAVRPPGHHAFPDHGEGFCLLNNIVIGALHAQSLGCARIAIVDFDVHHGNGSDAMTRIHDNIFYASTHQCPLYPGTGHAKDNIPNRILNIPMKAGDGSLPFRQVYEQRILPAVRHFQPDLLMISAGFDAHKDDPLAQMELETADFAWITAELAKLARECCRGKLVSALEGGYNLAALSDSVAAHLKALMD
ncbi:MAG: histone deacetylase family protein [Micavibrio aeruginosavorus]|uniref:Histone deacetylase family protein n=1 Tax=Micavibrio aeruginosavorus TaxID=349221 RepID=A0A7T5R423_9BACT|nr:MAG: histone deacetylase family protein [Micavibrio aeruginosavorus]